MQISAKKVAKYALLPQIVPRLRDLLTSGFEYTAFLIARIYHAARLLPMGHPYLNPANMGQFGIRHVIAAAAGNLRLRKENIDQILVFLLILVGFSLIVLQFCILGFSLFIQAADAAMPTNFAGFVKTENPTDDIAFILLEKVLGVPGSGNPGFFNSCVSQNIECFASTQGNRLGVHTLGGVQGFPWGIHKALHSLLQFYSIGLLVIAALIFAYFVVAVVVETAQSGTPFGKRFNHVWAPIRMVVALGLLIPLSTGLNAAQYITLYAAKWGSGFATNGWNIFIDAALKGDSTLAAGEKRQNMVANVKAPEITNLLEYVTVLQTCWASYRVTGNPNIRGWIVGDTRSAGGSRPFNGTEYEDALSFSHNGDILIVFGEKSSEDYTAYLGFVKPLCGEVVLPTTSIKSGGQETGPVRLQKAYYDMMKDLWLGGQSTECKPPSGGGGGNLKSADMENWGNCLAELYAKGYKENPNAQKPTLQDIRSLIQNYDEYVKNAIKDAVEAERTRPEWQEKLETLGWAGAGIWYNTVAQINGAVVAAAVNVPQVRNYPVILRDVEKGRLKANQSTSGRNRYQPHLAGDRSVELDGKGDLPRATAMWEAYNLWTGAYTEATSNIFIDAIRTFFGVDGLFNMRENIDIHPLAQLSSIGKSLVETAIRNLAISLGGSVLGGMAMIVGIDPGGYIQAASGFFNSIAMIGLSAGFVLFYVIPFLPFIYFFFAVGKWIKTIFEAMVGVPLWALAHIHIDGEGMPGQHAMGGYYLILEIFLRPILIIFGLLAAILIFSAQVRVLNDIWPLVTSNLAGFDTADVGQAGQESMGSIDYLRNIADSFFFTVIYAIIVYMIGMASFKLIDTIPNYLLRWMGASAQTFAENAGDAADNLVRNVSFGTSFVSQGVGGLQSGISGVSKVGQGLTNRMFGGGGGAGVPP